MRHIIELLKMKNYQVSECLLFNYKKLNMTELELIILIYITNQDTDIYNPKKISNDLNISMNDVLEAVSSLSEKNILKVDIDKSDSIIKEVINLDSLYEKLGFTIEEPEPENKEDIYNLFEIEFGRPLSPMEYEIITGWISAGYTEEIIKLALKEAVYNNVSSLRYIDKIIFEWNKKGIKTKEDVEKNKKSFKNKGESNSNELFDYDWLNDDN